MRCFSCITSSFFFNDTATTEIYTLSIHDALPILLCARAGERPGVVPADRPRDGAGRHRRRGRAEQPWVAQQHHPEPAEDRKSTRLNSSHLGISYAVFCLKKKKREVLRD